MTPRERLTPKEIQIAILVWEGLTNREIGKLQDIGMSEQIRPVTLVRKGRPAKHIAQRRHVPGTGSADEECRHICSFQRQAFRHKVTTTFGT